MTADAQSTARADGAGSGRAEALFRLRTEIAQLRAALTSNRTIGIAIGRIVEHQTVSVDEAFAVLRTISQHRNRKLRHIAQDVVDRGVETVLGSAAAQGRAG